MDSKWVKTKILGKGSYGTVSLAKPVPGYLLSDRLSAVKSADIYRSSSLIMEGRIMYQLDGCHQIVRCFGEDVSFENGRKIYNLLMEYAPGGTLADIIKARGSTIPEYEASMYAYMLLLGLGRIHQEGFVHCDLKPANILVFPKRKDGVLVNRLKITDFGLVKKSGCPGGVISKHGPLYKLRGTPQYSSPESVLMGINEPPMDIWSLGCILIEILRGESPYSGAKNLDELLGNIASSDYVMKMPNFLSEKADDFLKKCLTRDPEKRWTAAMLLEHPFIVHHYNKLYGEQKDLISWVDGPICYNPWWPVNDPNCPNRWWSGQSTFSISPSPMPFCFPPHHVVAAAGCAFFHPRYICSTNHVPATTGYSNFAPQHIISRNNFVGC